MGAGRRPVLETAAAQIDEKGMRYGAKLDDSGHSRGHSHRDHRLHLEGLSRRDEEEIGRTRNAWRQSEARERVVRRARCAPSRFRLVACAGGVRLPAGRRRPGCARARLRVRGTSLRVRGGSSAQRACFEGEASWAPVGRLFAAAPRGCWAFFFEHPALICGISRAACPPTWGCFVLCNR